MIHRIHCHLSSAVTDGWEERRRRAHGEGKQKLCSSENLTKKKKEAEDPSSTCLNQHQENKWPVTFFCKTTTTKNHIITELTLPDSFAILMRCSVAVNKALLFCLLVSQTTSRTSDPCCDPARRQRTIPRGGTAAEFSDVLI